MTGPELKSIREAHGLSLYKMGQALGYSGTRQSVKTTMHRYETRPDLVPASVVLRLIELGWHKPERRTIA